MVQVIIGAFAEKDLRRLHALLVAYESPYHTPGERAARDADIAAHDTLRKLIAMLLEQHAKGRFTLGRTGELEQ